MPPIDKHIRVSKCRTGSEYRDVHEWIDGDPARKAERHDITKIHEYGKLIEERFGREGLEEYIRHIHDDVKGKFGHIMHDLDSKVSEALAYFGVKTSAPYSIKEADVEILKKAGVSEADIRHCVKVAEKALEIASRLRVPVDFELVGRGSLFHDLGKAKSHEMEHGRVGAELGAAIGLPAELTAIMEKHIRGGLSEAEATELGLPVKDYSLDRLEERIVIYADRLVDIITDGIVTISSEAEAEERFIEILRNYPKYRKNDITLARYTGYHREIQALMLK